MATQKYNKSEIMKAPHYLLQYATMYAKKRLH